MRTIDSSRLDKHASRLDDHAAAGGPATGGGASLPLLAGAATAVCGVGAALALADITSPLRAPFTLFFLLVAPGAAVAAALPRLDPLSRAVVGLSGAVVVNVLVAQGMIVLEVWSACTGVLAISVLSAGTLLVMLLRRALAGNRVRRSRPRAAAGTGADAGTLGPRPGSSGGSGVG